VNEYLRKAGEIFNKVAGSTLRQLEANRDLAQAIETYNNSFVRTGTIIGDTKAHTEGLIKHISKDGKKKLTSSKPKKVRAVKPKAETNS
jgi:hypothetical protein